MKIKGGGVERIGIKNAYKLQGKLKNE